MMKQHQSIANHLQPILGTVQWSEMLIQIRALARAGRYQSIIVTDNKRPVGVIRWEEIDRANRIPESSLARDIMLADAPVLTRRTTIQEAQSCLDVTELDRLPVVDSQGELIGIVARNTLKEAAPMENNNTQRPAHDQPTTRQTRRAFTVQPGMHVISVDGARLGLVDRLFLDLGVVTGFLVSLDGAGEHHKHLDFDTVDHLEDEIIILAISRSTFHGLPDVTSRD